MLPNVCVCPSGAGSFQAKCGLLQLKVVHLMLLFQSGFGSTETALWGRLRGEDCGVDLVSHLLPGSLAWKKRLRGHKLKQRRQLLKCK